MSWAHLLALGAAGLASMKAAMDRGDLDEAMRQGALAGPAIVEAALEAVDRPTRLAAIAAAPGTEDRAELLEGLARAASGPDRRSAVPAARAAREIARGLSGAGTSVELPDDLAPADLAQWRDTWAAIATNRERWIEVRVAALDTAAALDRAIRAAGGAHREGVGLDLGATLGDPDPAIRAAAVMNVPAPVPVALRPAVAAAVVKDTDDRVALAAAQALCFDLVEEPPEPTLDALGEPGLARLRSLATTKGTPRAALTDLAYCLAADTSPASTAVLRVIRRR